jgi:putative membrane protein
MESFFLFLGYFVAAMALLGVFVVIYTWVTPYDDFALIRQNNSAAATVLCGAILGFTFPLVAAIYFTHSFVEMAIWAAVTGVMQLLLFTIMRRSAGAIAHGEMASALLLATTSVAAGLLNAVCISN